VALSDARDRANQALLSEEHIWSNALIVGSVLLIVILALAVVASFSQVPSQRKLRVQHDDVLRREKEKELLLKEVHRRVKNNL
jgi:two-component sensor histidine kinase